jgi:hypothetical protein
MHQWLTVDNLLPTLETPISTEKKVPFMYSTVTNLVYVGATKTMYPESWKIAHFTTSVRNSYLYIKIAFSSHLGGLSDGFIPSLVRNTVYIICSRKTKNPQLSRSCTGKEKLDPETVSITSLVCKVGHYQCPKEYIYCIHGRNRVHTSSRQDKCQGSMNINRYLKLRRSWW